ncbi:MAG: FkbM family methyltransferase [Planctomycetota bacterium]|jgi:FkbM family methyltransferase
MKLADWLSKIVFFLENKGSLKALRTWPKFSFLSYLLVSRLRKHNIFPRTVLDVGANVGQYAVAAAKLFSNVQVYSFEPEPDSIKQLRKNTSSFDNIKIIPIAIGDSIGEIDFQVNTYRQASSILPLSSARRKAFPSAKVCETIKVELSTLDNALAGIELQRPILLKLDVQGYESKVLFGASEILKKVDYVLVETCFEPLYEGEVVFWELLGIMERYGFKFSRPVNSVSSPVSGEIVEMDVLFVRADTNYKDEKD